MITGLLSVSALESRAALVSGIMGGGQACSDSICFTPTMNKSTSGSISGQISFDATSVQFDMTLASAVFLPTGASDNGVTQLDLTTVRYVGSANYNPTTKAISGGSAQISGLATPTGAGSPVSFQVSGVPVSGTCGTSTCGIFVGPSTSYSMQLNGATRYFANTLNVTVPEPAGLALLGLGLTALTAVRSRRSRS